MEDPSSVAVAAAAASAYYYETMMAKQQFPIPDQQEQLKCPRCDSPNTKFCYYNNYNLSQPRHFCKSCRRYWTKGGALRNVPIGGASRKNSKRSSGSSTTSSSSNKKTKNQDPVPVLTTKPESSPNRVLYGFSMGEQDLKGIESGSFSSLLASNMQLGLGVGGIFLNGSGWDSGLDLGNEGGYEQSG